MTVMYDQQAFDSLKKFFESHPVSYSAARFLKADVDIGVVINDHNECTYYKGRDGHPHFERRRPVDPDLTFYLTPEAIQSMVDLPHNTLSEVVQNVVRNYLIGTIKIRFAGPLPHLFLRGYLHILRAGGTEYVNLVKGLGGPVLSKIFSYLKR